VCYYNTAAAGREVLIRLSVRRLFCGPRCLGKLRHREISSGSETTRATAIIDSGGDEQYGRQQHDTCCGCHLVVVMIDQLPRCR
jgi:hypothetical protein